MTKGLNNVNFGHVITAMVTPFDHNNRVDFSKTTKLIEHLINTGTDCLVVAGTTGESPTLSFDEKVSLFEHTVEVVAGRIPVIAGTGSNNTFISIELTKKAESVGVDGVMLVAPYYNKPSQKGMYEHFKTIANATTLPVMLYNIPSRSVVNMTTELVVELSKIDNIIAIKEASGNLDQVTSIISGTSDDFLVYSGDDSLTLPLLAVGGNGVVSVASHVVGKEFKEMITAFNSGQLKEAAKLHQQLLPLVKALFKAPNPCPVKAALALKGIDVGGVRLPLVPLSEIEREDLAKVLK
ncbi:4-hydroxy-tetrahydrodipicolinate synthase [Anaerobacillus alkalidiazotrophicus]|uniref:4-hydroxy-tetrahydrodipicolinate synthase n=1 Tax=Anaerobacillus alkalidiazotrophicus TaxID=472963 RepID=A0A1S2M061_9BACI|nr:4-hydroxy-tetrahydrodipicolinate synthase [Anaerobacillus alkalidiazotrophicus]OIJ17890.1 4-hydroxy-tetrahydrodipicolinate synthase [Anaerobacillus alkalidiazotrophicus]